MKDDSFKKASNIIINLQNKNASLRMALLNIISLCDDTKQHLESEIWFQKIAFAKQIIKEIEKNN